MTISRYTDAYTTCITSSFTTTLLLVTFCWWFLVTPSLLAIADTARSLAKLGRSPRFWNCPRWENISLGSGRYTLVVRWHQKKDAIYLKRQTTSNLVCFEDNDLIIGRKRTHFGGYLGIDSRIWPNLKLLRPKSRLIRSFHHRFFLK